MGVRIWGENLMLEKFIPKLEVPKDKIVINNKMLNKYAVAKHISDWTRQKFLFTNGTTNLKQELKDNEWPINGIGEELLDLTNFKEHDKDAHTYMVLAIFAMGVKAGKETVAFEKMLKEEDAKRNQTP